MSRLLASVILSPAAVIVVSLATRASIDKMLALQPDMSLIAYLAQAQSLFDITTAVALSGIGSSRPGATGTTRSSCATRWSGG